MLRRGCADVFGGGARTLADTLADSLLERY